MMQHCFYNLRYICYWIFIASAKDIWDIECECIRCWINERVTYIKKVPCITAYKGTEKKYSVKIRNPMLKHFVFICFPYSIYPYRSSKIWIWKFARTVTTAITSAVFIKLTARFVILMFSCWPRWSANACVAVLWWMQFSCKQKRVRRNV